ncbi:hypothetical protein GCM10009807_14690 [Microbacterium lacus]|uniref:Uncharacterized protein n=1 Tax=Microbacterium lacus TaxID=415217 RepID=A0ABN2GHZ0_9MICO
MEDLQGGGDRDEVIRERRGGSSGLLHSPPPCDAEPAAQTLPALQSGRTGLDEEYRLRPEIGGGGALRRQEHVQTLRNSFDGIRRG